MRRRTGLRVLVVVLGCFAWGLVTGLVPGVDDPAQFWVGNLAAPYVVLPFFGSLWVGRRAPLVGLAATEAMVLGFYDVLAPGVVNTASSLGLPEGTSRLEVVLAAYGNYVRPLVLGPTPWLVIGAAVGLVAGWLATQVPAGRRWSSWLAPLVLATLVAEPGLDAVFSGLPGLPATYDTRPANLAVWGAEATVGVLAVAVVLRARARATTHAGGTTPGLVTRPYGAGPR